MTANSSIACSLTAAGLSDRQGAWQRLTARALCERQMTARGVRLVFAPEPGVQSELRELALLEQECCAFADWRVEDHGDRLVLEVSAEADGVGALHAMFDGPLSANQYCRNSRTST